MSRGKRGGRPRHGRGRKRGRRERGRREGEKTPLLDDLLGARTAHRARLVSAVSIAVLILGGCALFLFESQTFGRIALALGVGWGLMWMVLRHSVSTGGDFLEEVRRRRWTLIGVGTLLVGAGWVVFFAVWEELGLLLVVLGAGPLFLLLAGVRHEPMVSPMDGPPFGETEQGS